MEFNQLVQAVEELVVLLPLTHKIRAVDSDKNVTLSIVVGWPAKLEF